MCRKLIYLVGFVLVLALARTNVAFGGTVWEGRIVSDNDDVEESVPGGGIDFSSSDLELPYEGTGQSNNQAIGVRFLNVVVPKGASVSNAYLEFTVDELKGGTDHVSLIIVGELSPNAGAFTATASVTSRPTTTEKVVWVPSNWTQEGEVDQTSNIAPVINEIISQRDWTQGNAMVIIIRDDPDNPSVGLRCAEAGPGDVSAMLHIEWSFNNAREPNPGDGEIDVPRDLVLSWTPGAATAPVNGHTVYFSDNFDDVKDGIGGIAQSTNSYAVPNRLDFNTTYYWRVDEVNNIDPESPWIGTVWSCTTESFVHPVKNIIATASSTGLPDMGPENTIDGSGLDGSDLHSAGPADMWISDSEPLGAWIEYEFDTVYKLYEMWAWNSNELIEFLVGFGLKDVTIEYSTDGTDYTTLGTTQEFAQAPGAPGYACNTIVDFGGMATKYVKLTANSNWGGIVDLYGLSEVRFLYIPVNARKPYPESGATGVPRDVVLGWRAGREADTHDVYFSDDEQAVIDGTTTVETVTEASYGPLSLELGRTYYWRVDEANEAETPAIWQGSLWSFTATDHLVVDDFESYGDYPPDEIWSTWIDGYDNPINGSTVGYPEPVWAAGEHFVETKIVHGGKQAMPLFYSNTTGATYSEAELTFAAPQDWTEAGVQTLGLYFHGTAGNTGQLYVKVNGSKVAYDGDIADIEQEQWNQWNIDLASFGANLQNVTTLTIGIDGNDAGGTLYIDDIGLYVPAP
ncbi:MAG TPA: discoidin domain-containing protein [Sedimentisphaerales bacterium]|nr:discoidin domain-containing protein [Sedimentisphaerales bacterium]